MSTITIGSAAGNAVTYTPDTTGNIVFTTAGGIINAASVNGAVILPSGTTNNRSAGIDGTIRYNTSNASLEVYVAGEWKNFP